MYTDPNLTKFMNCKNKTVHDITNVAKLLKEISINNDLKISELLQSRNFGSPSIACKVIDYFINDQQIDLHFQLNTKIRKWNHKKMWYKTKNGKQQKQL